jgi:hypothetical protein
MERAVYMCVDGHGDERIFSCNEEGVKPYRSFPNMNLEVAWGQRWTTASIDSDYKHGVLLPKGTIKHLIGRELNYSDEPVKIEL